MLTIADVQDMRNAPELRQKLLDAIEPGTACSIDISGVSQADLTFVQLIEAARRHAAGLGGTLSLTAPAPVAVLDVLTQAGFLARPEPSDRAFWTQGSLPQ